VRPSNLKWFPAPWWTSGRRHVPECARRRFPGSDVRPPRSGTVDSSTLRALVPRRGPAVTEDVLLVSRAASEEGTLLSFSEDRRGLRRTIHYSRPDPPPEAGDPSRLFCPVHPAVKQTRRRPPFCTLFPSVPSSRTDGLPAGRRSPPFFCTQTAAPRVFATRQPVFTRPGPAVAVRLVERRRG